MIKKIRNKLFKGKKADGGQKRSSSKKVIVFAVCFILVCTFLSRAASSMLTPKVVTRKPSTDKITHYVFSDGIIEAVKKTPVYIADGMLVDEVYIKQGDDIDKGMPLVRYNSEDLEKTLQACNIQMELYMTERKQIYDKTEIDYKISNLQERIDALSQLAEDNYILYSNISGRVLDVNVDVGQYSSETAAFIVADGSMGFIVTAAVPLSDIDYVREGDTATINIGDETEVFTVESVILDENDSEIYDVTGTLTGDSYSDGMVAAVTFTCISEKTGFTVPNQAVRAELGGTYYVLTIGYKDGILGEEKIAKKVIVNRIDYNNTYAVVESTALSPDDLIIIDSDRSIEPGDVIREED